MTHKTPRIAAVRAWPTLLLLALFFLPARVQAASAENFMTVADIPVDITAGSAAAARDQAIAEAQAKAFAKLIERMVPNEADRARVSPSHAEIESFVQDFAIESERTSSVRYIGRYSVRFRANRVREYLAGLGIASVAEVQQALVLPVYDGPDGPVLWGQRNIWRAAWDRGGFGEGPVTLILPNADAFDSGTVPAQAALDGDMSALHRLMLRYHAAGIVVAAAHAQDASQNGPGGVALDLKIYDSNGPGSNRQLTVEALPGEQIDQTLARAVVAASQALQTGWQEAIAANGSTGLTGGEPGSDADWQGADTHYAIAMPITEIGEWVRARGQLTATQGVESVSLDAMTRGMVAFTLNYAGDPLALQAALANSGYVLVQTSSGANGGTFQLRPAAPVVAPAR